MKRYFFILIVSIRMVVPACAQVGTTINLKGLRPQEYANKTLPAERTPYGKIRKPRKFVQNTFVRYNYWFNANQILDSALQQAMTLNVDDYSRLLPFFPYDEKKLSGDKALDSVITHATAGLLLHDLRNTLIDELYYLTGKAYAYERKFDSAQQVFLYINYVFGRRDDGYFIPIGSNVSSNSDKRYFISSKEKSGFNKSGLNNINRRNDALVWLARISLERKDYAQAEILLNNLSKDAHFPARLLPFLYETKAYFYYRQQTFDSAAKYLSQCNFSYDTKLLKARRAYLTAQMYELAGDDSSAYNYFDKAKNMTSDERITIYSEKNKTIIINRHNGLGILQSDLANMVKKNKYYLYRDLIYYNEAEIAYENRDDKNTISLLKKAVQANRSMPSRNPELSSKIFYLLGNIEYDNYHFAAASAYYDSISGGNNSDTIMKLQLKKRVPPLKNIVKNVNAIYLQDSLLNLANMPEKQRMDILKAAARRIRKAIDQKEETANDNNNTGFDNTANIAQPNQQQTNIFGQNGNTSASWYFNNGALKSSGYQLFKQKFGNRPNVDNWQRNSAINSNATAQTAQGNSLNELNPDGTPKIDSSYITTEDLLANLPMTKKAKESAVNNITQYMLNNGKILQNSLENYKGAIFMYGSLIAEYPHAKQVPEALYNTIICYSLLGDSIGAEINKTKLLTDFPQDTLIKKLTEQPPPAISRTSLADSAANEYNEIYNLFLAGKFDEANQRKKIADSVYGKTYWTPQLMYIEAIYHVSKKEDSAAINILDSLVTTFSKSPIVPQAKTMADVLRHRRQIEDYLRTLNISPENYLSNNTLEKLENAADRLNQSEGRIVMFRKNQLVQFPVSRLKMQPPSLAGIADKHYTPFINVQEMLQAQMAARQSKSGDTANNHVAANNNSQINPPNNPQNNAVQPPVDTTNNHVAANNIPNNQLNNTAQPQTGDTANNRVAVNNNPQINPPNNAVQPPPVVDTTNKKVPADNNSVALNNPQSNPANLNKQAPQQAPNVPPSGNAQPQQTNAPQTSPVVSINGFTFDANTPQYATVVLNNVAPVFAQEAGNAFNRYNLITFPNRQYSVHSQSAGDYTLVLIGPFKNIADAQSYQSAIQDDVAGEIIPWITPDKYSFMTISPDNLAQIQTNADMDRYKASAKIAGE